MAFLHSFCTGAAGSPGSVQGRMPSTSNMQQHIKSYATQNPNVLEQAFHNSSLFSIVSSSNYFAPRSV